VIADVRPDTRIVVQLEQKQVFFVLMGILVLASGILVLGYVLGLNVATPAAMSAKELADGRRSQRGAVRQGSDDESAVELTFHEKVMSPTAAATPMPEAPTVEEVKRRGMLAKAAVAKAIEQARAPALGKPAKAAPKADKIPAKLAPVVAAKAKKNAPAAPAVKITAAKNSSARRAPAAAVERKVDEAAADALAILKRLRKAQEKPSPPSAAGAPATVADASVTDRRYTVQVGAFQTREDALAMLDKLRGRGHNPFLVSSKVRSRGRWYRVRVGRFADKSKAKDYQRRVEVAEDLKGTFVARL
jgi:cell division septation protein DedD